MKVVLLHHSGDGVGYVILYTEKLQLQNQVINRHARCGTVRAAKQTRALKQGIVKLTPSQQTSATGRAYAQNKKPLLEVTGEAGGGDPSTIEDARMNDASGIDRPDGHNTAGSVKAPVGTIAELTVSSNTFALKVSFMGNDASGSSIPSWFLNWQAR